MSQKIKQDIMAEIEAEYQKRKGQQYPTHIVAKAAKVTTEANKLTSFAMLKKYNDDGNTLHNNTMRLIAIKCIVQCILFVENLEKK